jgi:predicted RNase H-like HicB family nuclease
MTYQAVFERAPDGAIWAYIPELPGVAGSGDTLDAARESIGEGLRLWLEDARADGDVIPEPATIGVLAIDAA